MMEQPTKKKAMLDTVIGPVSYVMDGNTFQMQVTHIGKHNKFTYSDYETIRIADRVVHNVHTPQGYQQQLNLNNQIYGKRVRCHVKHRDSYNRLVCTFEVI